MVGVVFKPNNVVVLPPGLEFLKQVLDEVMSDSTSVEMDASATAGESAAVLTEEADPGAQSDSEDADIAFVGDQHSSENEEPVGNSDADPLNELLNDEELLDFVGGVEWWHEEDLLGQDGFAFHADSDKFRESSEPEQDRTADMTVFVWVCESEEPEVELDEEAVQGEFSTELTFLAQDPGDAPL